MDIKEKEIIGKSIKFFIEEDGKEVARAYLYLIKNELHKESYGFMEDVFVDESKRGKGLGSKIVKRLIEKAKEKGCYKLVCTSRHTKPKVHELYLKFGFKEHGKEFRIDF